MEEKHYLIFSNINDSESEKMLIDLDIFVNKDNVYDNSEDIILVGDYYHDKIDSQMEGFFRCLDYYQIPFKVFETKGKNDNFFFTE